MGPWRWIPGGALQNLCWRPTLELQQLTRLAPGGDVDPTWCTEELIILEVGPGDIGRTQLAVGCVLGADRAQILSSPASTDGAGPITL